MTLREADIERYLVARVKSLGGEVRKVKWIGRRGAPDRVAMLARPPRYEPETIWIELKSPGELPELHQQREHQRMRRLGQRVEVVDSMARVDEVLE